MPYDYSDFNHFSIKNNVERYAYIGWNIFVIICSILGDTTILVASIKYKAFRLNKIVVVLIEHVAACDLLQVVGNILPATISAIRNRGGCSKILCYVDFFLTYYLNTTSSSFIAAMTLGKLLLLKYPLRVGMWSKKRAHKVCAGIWLVSFAVPALHILDKNDVIFDYRVYDGSYQYTKTIWTILLPVTALIALFAPNVTIIVSTVLLLKEAKKAVKGTRESLRWQGIMTVVLTATVYSVSYLPITVYFIAEDLVEKYQEPAAFFMEFYRVAGSVMIFNILSNFFVYSLTVDSFRSFLKKVFEKAASFPFLTVFFQGSVSL